MTTTPHEVPAPPEGPWLYAPGEPPRTPLAPAGATRAVLFDRDGTLVEDVPYNGDPALVRLMPHAREALEAVRARGVAVGVVSNQSGVARGLLTRRQVEAVRRRVEELLGPFGVWAVCPHGPGDGCPCRKPAPGLVFAACARLGVAPEETVVIGDIGADLGAARAAGARGVLVPTPVTRAEETDAAPERAADLLAAVRVALGRPPSGLDLPSGLDRRSREDRRPSPPSREGRPSGEADGPSGEGSAA
ncbi:HAD family hydrolase [Streptomyces albus]|uniref:D-glycero-alpha-D-manno-heptose-1,7-bisphosphate 7-phosphatase n=1 Tax=Streptomyces albus TaxID=1888 RepID=UPI001ABFB003